MILEWILLLIIGLFAGTIGSIVGIGGGIIIVPSLLFVASIYPSFGMMTPQLAVGTSLLLIVITALASILSFHKQKRIDYSSGLIFFISAGPGSMIGAYLSKFFSTDSFMLGFGLFLILLFLIMMLQNRIKPFRYNKGIARTFVDQTGQAFTYSFHTPTALAISFVVGILSGMFGIGGGAMLVPMMILLFRFPAHVATATSMLVIFLSSIMGSVTHIMEGHIVWVAILLLAPGSWIGGRLGAMISQKLSSRTLLIIFRSILVLVSIRMILAGAHLI
jgi:uncharacterized protein